MFHLSKSFVEAANDYLYLLERNYPQKSILKLVGDKYQLISQERSMLFRGIISRESCNYRKTRMADSIQDGSSIFIDGYNIIRTIGSYLLGKPVFIAMDGFVRDASEMHRTTLKKKILDQTIDLIITNLTTNKPENVIIYLDEPVSKSGELAFELNNRLSKAGIAGIAKTVHSPDHFLKDVDSGIISTSDSAIIDHSQALVFDLAKVILVDNYQPELNNFEEMIINH